jgi:serine/threonine protein kinase
VFEVEHIELGKRFVLKALLPQFLERKDLVQRLRNEWRSLGKLEHPNIVSVTDAGVARNGVPFYVMERLQGETLAAAIKSRHQLPLVDALRFSCEILEGLSAAHEIGVVHRDVKPPNIFLTQGGAAKILDFGIAKLLDGASLELTSKGVAIGTPRYMSPEQAAGEPVDGRADLYAVGLLLFEMIAGVGPFDGGDSNEVFLAHLTKQPPRLASLVPGIPPELDGFVALLLAKHPAERPVSASAAAKTLRAILRGVPQLRPDTLASPLSIALTPAIPVLPVMARAELPRAEPRIFRGIGKPASMPAPDSTGETPRAVAGNAGGIRTPAPLGRAPTDAITLGLASPMQASPVRGGAAALDLAATFNDAPPTRTAVPMPSTPPPVASSSRPPAWSEAPPTPVATPTRIWPWLVAAGISSSVAVGALALWFAKAESDPRAASALAEGRPQAVNPSEPARPVAQSQAGRPEVPLNPGVLPKADKAPASEAAAAPPEVLRAQVAGKTLGGEIGASELANPARDSSPRGTRSIGASRTRAERRSGGGLGTEASTPSKSGAESQGANLPTRAASEVDALTDTGSLSVHSEKPPAPAKARLPGPGFPTH